MYERQAEKHGALLYPFFLDGVAADGKLNQADGIHPNPAGVDVIVSRILPSVEQLDRQGCRKIGLGFRENRITVRHQRFANPSPTEEAPQCHDCSPVSKFPVMWPSIST